MDIRMPSINNISLSGNLTDDPRETVLESGTYLVAFQMAHDERYKDRGGEWQSKPHYISVVVWGKTAERLTGKLHKGSPVIVDGSIDTNHWTDKHEQKRKDIQIKAHRVQAIEKMQSNQQQNNNNNPPDYNQGSF